MGRKVLFSAQKNEGPFLLEWIAYHKAVGFTDIVVYSNDCTDGSDLLLDRLAEAGEVVHHRQVVPPGVAPQRHAADLFAESGFLRDGDWVIWLDSDEFLLATPGDRRVEDLIAAAGDADAVMIAWRFFGDGGNAVWPGRHVSSAFTTAALRRRSTTTQVKTLFRHGPKIERLDIHRPVLRAGVGPSDFKVITSAEVPADPSFFDRRRRVPFNRMTGDKRPLRLGQVAHFSIRTPDMFALKAHRGDGYYARENDLVRRDAEFYRKKNFNEVKEQGLLHHEAATGDEMFRLMDLAGVAEACAAIRHFRGPAPVPVPAPAPAMPVPAASVPAVSGPLDSGQPQSGPLESEPLAPYPLPIFHWTAKQNFGDLIGPMVVGGITGRPTRTLGPAHAGAYLLSVGSIIQTITRPGAVIWGSGLLRPIEPRWLERLRANPVARVLAVRGRLTRADLIRKLRLDVPEVFGDPALLLPRLFPFPGRGTDIVICPHLSHRAHFAGFAAPGMRLVDVGDDPLAVIRAIATADRVISSSLHGLIVAQAYGVPWLWLQMEDRPLDRSDFKFLDFFSTLDMARAPCFAFTPEALSADSLRQAADAAGCFDLSIDLDALAAALPRTWPLS